MTKDPAFLFYPGDYLQDTQCLSERTQVAYDRIMCEHMRNICISKQQLKFFTKRLTDEEREELVLMLTEKNEGYQITWVAESIEKRRLYSESRRKNRESPKEKKIEKDQNISKSYVKHMVNENENENTIKEKNGNELIIYPSFDDFWDLYDKKISRPKAQQKWDKLKQKEKEKIMGVLPVYLFSTQDKQFRKNPVTYLNNKSWEDEIILKQKNESLRTQTERIRRKMEQEGQRSYDP